MPVFKYECSACGLVFDKLTPTLGGESEVSCLSCQGPAPKVITGSNFNFGSKATGPTGVHDVDYPNIDKAVGRSSEDRWTVYNTRKDFVKDTRKDFNQTQLGKIPIGNSINADYYPVSDQKLQTRKEVVNEYKEIEKSQV
jgi:putative FmdB family regulatory protein